MLSDKNSIALSFEDIENLKRKIEKSEINIIKLLEFLKEKQRNTKQQISVLKEFVDTDVDAIDLLKNLSLQNITYGEIINYIEELLKGE